jgi:hypothetical protein
MAEAVEEEQVEVEGGYREAPVHKLRASRVPALRIMGRAG